MFLPRYAHCATGKTGRQPLHQPNETLTRVKHFKQIWARRCTIERSNSFNILCYPFCFSCDAQLNPEAQWPQSPDSSDINLLLINFPTLISLSLLSLLYNSSLSSLLLSPLYSHVVFCYCLCTELASPCWCRVCLSSPPGGRGTGWLSCHGAEMERRRRGWRDGQKRVSWATGSEKDKMETEQRQRQEEGNSCSALHLHLPPTTSWITSLESLPS